MLSGRALGHTGGTLDKLESIPGYSTAFEHESFLKLLQDPGGAIVGQSDDLVPADRELYALRDVTATIDCVPLIVASILSKKFAAGVDGVVLDVKVGSGAFMRDLARAQELAAHLVSVGRAFQKSVAVLFTRMDEPLGEAVGNANEVVEAVQLLRGGGPEDLRQVTLALAATMLQLGGVESQREAARRRAEAALRDGTALERFRHLVEAQGGKLDWESHDCGLEVAPVAATVRAPRRATLQGVDGTQVGWAVVDLGGGRQRKGDRIDPAVGLHWKARIGDLLEAGEVVAEIRSRPGTDVTAVQARLDGALAWGDAPLERRPLILGQFPKTL
jgi:pyrimidine-nucleoside phosphorylase